MNREFSIIERCFVRDKKCERILGGAKIAFIASPDEDDVQLELEILREILKRYDIEPFIAVEFREPGRDIFCEKICGKIIESLFCIVLLNDKILESDALIPNPNVYYEYGLMTSLDKRIIPLQKADQKLAFNIQSLDTIKYTNKTFKKEVEAAIEGILIKPEGIEKQDTEIIPKKVTLYLALRGLSWPQLAKGSDTEYAILIGSGLGFFMLMDFNINGFCYLRIIRADEDEGDLLPYLRALVTQISAVRANVARQKEELETVAKGQMFVKQPSWTKPTYTQEKKQARYLGKLIKVIDRTKILLYRPSFRDRTKILNEYNELNKSMKLPELTFCDDDEIETFISK